MAGPSNAPEYFDSLIDICGVAENLKLYFANDLISQFYGVLPFARTECAQKAFNVKKRESLEACTSQRMDQVRNAIAVYKRLDLFHDAVSCEFCAFALRSERFSSHSYSTGSRTSVSRVELISPPTTTVASGR